MSTTGRTVLVTGCSSGFGLHIAVEAAKAGWTVYAGLRDTSRDGALRDAARRAGVQVNVLELDVTDSESISTATKTVLGFTSGRLDAVVHNAGVGGAGFLEELSEAEINEVIATNLLGPIHLTRALLPALRKGSGPRIIVISTVGAFWPGAATVMYQASKWALEGWAEALAIELRPLGVDVALIEPGTYKTDIWGKVALRSTPDGPYEPLAAAIPPRVDKLVARFGRDPKEVGVAVTRVLNARRVKLRTPVGPDAHLARILRRYLPFGARRRIALMTLGLPRKPVRN